MNKIFKIAMLILVALFIQNKIHKIHADTSWVSEYAKKEYSCSVAEAKGIQQVLEKNNIVKITFLSRVDGLTIDSTIKEIGSRFFDATNNKDIYRYVGDSGQYILFNAKTKVLEVKDRSTKKTLSSIKLNCIDVDDLD